MSLSDVTALGERLEDHYREYAFGTLSQPPRPKGFARLFRRWFTYNAQDIQPGDKAFLDGTEALIGELAAAVAALSPEEAEGGKAAAERAVALMTGEKPENIPNSRRLYLIAAEALCAPLLPLLDREALVRQRDAMVKVTPKRLMFPRQLELLEEMERLLEEKTEAHCSPDSYLN